MDMDLSFSRARPESISARNVTMLDECSVILKFGPVPGRASDGPACLRTGYAALAVWRPGPSPEADRCGAKGGLLRAVHELRGKRPAAPDRPVREKIRRQGQSLARRVRESAAANPGRRGGEAPRGRCGPLFRARNGDAASGENPASGRVTVLDGVDRGRAAAAPRMGRDLPVGLGAGLQHPAREKGGPA